MSYITLATPIGPWIAPTLVLIGTFLVHAVGMRGKKYSDGVAFVTAGGSIGGILATAFGFSFPTLFFLNPTLFAEWLRQPLFFGAVLSGLALSGGLLGLLIADLFEQQMIVKDELPFPVGQLVYKLIAAQNQARKAFELLAGGAASLIFTFLHSGFWKIKAILPTTVTMVQARALGPVVFPLIRLRLDILPMLFAIGFISGSMVAIPLLVGAISRIGIMEPVNRLFFAQLGGNDFLLAFGSGMIAIGAVQSFIELPKMLHRWFKKTRTSGSKKESILPEEIYLLIKHRAHLVQAFITFVIIVCYLTYFKFSIFSQFYLLFLSFICAYQIAVIAGEFGLAQLGRFATWVMVPAMFLFGVNPIHLTIISTFVEVCGGVTTDILFGRKIGHLASLDKTELRRYQIIGLIISSITIGVVFWLLISRFGLGGGSPLSAGRAGGRALLINATHFNLYVLALGALFGLLLKKLKLNPMLVLGGVLMPLEYSIGLILGGCFSFIVKDRSQWEPFWSGVFAVNSITQLIKTLL
jgi:uncharacterized oligopeptide transporter (OPT) family protein